MLALVGSGEYLPAMESIDRALIHRLGEPARVACLATAAGKEGAQRIAYWSRLGIGHFTRLGAIVDTPLVIDRTSANDRTMASEVAGANFVYLSGGRPDYLWATLEGSRVWEAILSVVAHGGLLAGCSAGAMVMGEDFFGFPGRKTGSGLLPGVTIIPHYDEIPRSFIPLVRLLAGQRLAMLGIEGATALVESDGQFEVLGRGGVTIWDKGGRSRYTRGPLLDSRLRPPSAPPAGRTPGTPR